MAFDKRKLAGYLPEQYFDEAIHCNDNQDLQINGCLNQVQQQQQKILQQQRKWKVELHDAELYVFCAIEGSEICLQKETDDAMMAPSKAAAIVIEQLSRSQNSLCLRVDDGLCWELDENSRVSKETRLDYSIIIPPDEHLLLILHKDVGAGVIAQIDEFMKSVCGNFDDSHALIRSEWELVGEYESPNTEDLIAQIIGHSGLRVANGINTGSKSLIQGIQQIGLFSRQATERSWKSTLNEGEDEFNEQVPPKVVESVQNALWVSEKGKEIVTGVSDTVTGITSYVSNGVANQLRATGWFTAPKDAPQWRSVRVAKTIGGAWVYSSGQIWDSIGKGVEGVVATSCKETTLFLKYKYGIRAGQVADNVCTTFHNCYNASKTLRKLCFKTVATDALQQTAYDLYPSQ